MTKNRAFYLTVYLLCLITSVSTAQSDIPQFRERLRIERGGLTSITPEYLAFSYDSSRIGTVTEKDRMLKVWDALTGETLLTIQDDGITNWVGWTPHERMIAAAAAGGSVLKFWDAQTGELQRTLAIEGGIAVFSPDFSRFATENGLYDTETGQQLAVLETWDSISTIAWSPDGKRFATVGGHDYLYLRLWNADGELLDTLLGYFWVAWSPDGTRLASMGEIRDAQTTLPLVVNPQMDGMFAWHPNGRWLVNEVDRALVLWDTETGEQIIEQPIDEGCTLHGITWNADGTLLAAICTFYDQQAQTATEPLLILEFIS